MKNFKHSLQNNRIVLQGILLTLLLPSALPSALEYNTDLYLSSEYESSGNLAPPSRAEVIHSTGLFLTASQRSQAWDLEASYDVKYNQFEKGTNSDRGEFSGQSALQLKIIKNRLAWDTFHSISESVPERNLVSTADNRERRQEITTGPLITIPAGKASRFTLRTDYTEVFFSEAETPDTNNNSNNADSKSLLSQLNWFRDLSPLTSLTAGGSYRTFERDDSDNTIEFLTTFVGIFRELRTLEYNIEMGSNQSKPEGGSRRSGFYFQLGANKSFSNSTIAFSASQEKTESSLGLNQREQFISSSDNNTLISNIALTQENSGLSDIVDITFVELKYNSSAICNRCNYSAQYNFIENDYEDNTALNNDDRVSQLELAYGFRFNTRLRADIKGNYRYTDFLNTGASNEKSGGGIYFRWDAARDLNVSIGGGYEQRKSGNSFNFYNSYGEIKLTYNLLYSK